MGDVVNGYSALASSLLDRWSDHAEKLATKIDGGELDAPAMASEMVSCATLATRSGLELFEEAIDAAAILAGGVGAEAAVSQPFHAPAGAALTITEPLELGAELGTLPVSAITVEPSQLGPDETRFTLRADSRECHGGTYVGKVKATTDAETATVTVWITVP
jgi:hypothetical protein